MPGDKDVDQLVGETIACIEDARRYDLERLRAMQRERDDKEACLADTRNVRDGEKLTTSGEGGRGRTAAAYVETPEVGLAEAGVAGAKPRLDVGVDKRVKFPGKTASSVTLPRTSSRTPQTAAGGGGAVEIETYAEQLDKHLEGRRASAGHVFTRARTTAITRKSREQIAEMKRRAENVVNGREAIDDRVAERNALQSAERKALQSAERHALQSAERNALQSAERHALQSAERNALQSATRATATRRVTATPTPATPTPATNGRTQVVANNVQTSAYGHSPGPTSPRPPRTARDMLSATDMLVKPKEQISAKPRDEGPPYATLNSHY